MSNPTFRAVDAQEERDSATVARLSAKRATDSAVTLTCARDIAPQPYDWLWADWLARGKLHVLAGAPGAGKTTIATSLAAIVSRGATWPDGSFASAGTVLFWSAEDDTADTLVPRLRAANADLDRVHFVTSTRRSGRHAPFNPATDVGELEKKIAGVEGVSFLVLDPIVSAVGGDSHKAVEVRRGLQPLVDLASRQGCAVLGITHFAKGAVGRDPLERILGSVAFGALARVVMVASRLPGDASGAGTLMKAKANICSASGGFSYAVEQRQLPEHVDIAASSIVWGSAVEGTAWEMLSEIEVPPEAGDVDSRTFLRTLLSGDPTPANKVFEAAEAAGFSRDQMHRARKRIGAVIRKEGAMVGKWIWSLPSPT